MAICTTSLVDGFSTRMSSMSPARKITHRRREEDRDAEAMPAIEGPGEDRQADRHAAQHRNRRCDASDRRADARRDQLKARRRQSGTSSTASRKAIAYGRMMASIIGRQPLAGRSGGRTCCSRIGRQRFGLHEIGIADRVAAGAGICDGR